MDVDTRKHKPTGYWALVCNPKVWDIKAFLDSGEIEDNWKIDEGWPEFNIGDLALIRVGKDKRTKAQLDGSEKLEAGIYAICEITSKPIIDSKSNSIHYLNEEKSNKEYTRVNIKYLYSFLDNPILLSDLKKINPTISPLLLRGHQGSSHPIPKDDFETIVGRIGLTIDAIKSRGKLNYEGNVGNIPGLIIGAEFADRKELYDAGVHKALVAGIVGKQTGVAESVVLNEGYVDDQDNGHEIIYTGAGGRDESTGRQIKDQVLSRTNLALERSSIIGSPVRVIRGYKLKSKYAPSRGYRYDGLYSVDSSWFEQGKDGFKIIRFKLTSIDQIDFSIPNKPKPIGTDQPGKTKGTVTRTIRDSKVTLWVKEHYNFECQVCGTTIETLGGRYAEGAHIKPIGKPHRGPDTTDNMLCLCPNHHVSFDKGTLCISDDYSLIGQKGTLHVKAGHEIDAECIRYHRGLKSS
jgi:putative restriction endonuclease